MVPQSPLKYSSTLLSSANLTEPSKREGKKNTHLLSSDGGFRLASLELVCSWVELHLTSLISVLLVLSLKWLAWRSGTLLVLVVAAWEDGWWCILSRDMVMERNLPSATAPAFSYEMGMVLHATLKRCMEMAVSPIPSNTPLIYFPSATSPVRLLLQQVNSL